LRKLSKIYENFNL